MSAPAVAVASDLTSEWLTQALGREVSRVESAVVGTGQMGTCYRLTLTGPGSDLPATVIAKLPPEDPASREMMAGAYANEIRFYRDIASTLDIAVPVCHYAAMGDHGVFTLLLEDLSPAEQGDQIAGCSIEEARGAVLNLAGLHGPRWCDPELWNIEGTILPTQEFADLTAQALVPAVESFVEMMGDLVSPEDAATLREMAPLSGKLMLGRGDRFGILHMDYRLDNLMFHPNGAVTAVDWQSMAVGLPARDISFFLSTGLTIEDRRAGERDIVADYHQALSKYGISDYSLGECWDDYRFGLLQNPFITVFGAVFGTRTERGDRMFAAMNERGCAAIRDLDALEVVASS